MALGGSHAREELSLQRIQVMTLLKDSPRLSPMGDGGRLYTASQEGCEESHVAISDSFAIYPTFLTVLSNW